MLPTLEEGILEAVRYQNETDDISQQAIHKTFYNLY